MTEDCKAKLIVGGTLIFIIAVVVGFLSVIPNDHYSVKIGDKVTKVRYCEINDGDLYYRIGNKRKTIANANGAECINDMYRE